MDTGANPNVPNGEGNTPLHYLVRCHVSDESKSLKLDLLNQMICNGGDVNAMNHVGETALHVSMFLGDPEVVNFLLDSYADTNIITRQGESCLHYAVQARSYVLVELLLNYGANPYITSANGKNAIDLAYIYHVPEITEIFRRVPLQDEVLPGESFAPRLRRASELQKRKYSTRSKSSPTATRKLTE